MIRGRASRAPVFAFAALALTACGGQTTSAGRSATAGGISPATQSSPGYVQHVVVVIQENRTLDNLFATFPGADGTTQGRMKLSSGGYTYVPLRAANLAEQCDFGHSYKGYLKDYDGGNMDGFSLEGGGKKCPGPTGTLTYQYVEPEQILPYWQIARQYVLGDQMYSTQGSGSFTNHQDLIAGGTTINAAMTKSLVDFPSALPWGCSARRHDPRTTTSLLVAKPGSSELHYRRHRGPFPCMSYATLRDLLDARSISWKYYSPPVREGTGRYWSAFEAIKAVREGPEWKTNVVDTSTFFSDVSYGTLPSVSWIVPDELNSDHPGSNSDTGPSWVAAIVNAIGESAYWNSTAIVIVWDDWGGFYDHEPPPFQDQWGGLGFRVPLLVVSPYAREAHPSQPGYISHTQYEFGSIVKFIEGNWNLGTLGKTDQRATSIIDCFDFAQLPRSFTAIPSKYSHSYFEHQRPSYRPVDSE
jgi:phospholipase C